MTRKRKYLFSYRVYVENIYCKYDNETRILFNDKFSRPYQ